MTAIEWFNTLQWIHVVLIVAILLLFTGYIYLLRKITQLRYVGGLIGKRKIRVFGILFGSLVVFYLFYNLHKLQPNEWVEISLLAGLVAATGALALYAAGQADASVRMAEEMRKQRRPIVAPKAFPAIGVPLEATAEEIAEHRYSDYFQIYNKGNSPAINLEVLLLNHEKSQLGCLKETVFSQGDKPLVFHPSGLVNHLQSTCYLVCRYCSVLSTEERQIWYETWLPFIPKKSQRGDQIIIAPKELDFHEEFERKSY